MKDTAVPNKKRIFSWEAAIRSAAWLIIAGLAMFSGPVAWVQADTRESNRAVAPEPFEAFLYYVDPATTHLKAVPRSLPPELDAHALGRAVLDALTSGPPAPGLVRALPENTRVNTLFITREGNAYVDIGLDPEDAGPGDTMTEYLGIYALVNTLTVNIPEIKQVRILVNGSDSAGLGDHLRLNRFFKTNMLIVK